MNTVENIKNLFKEYKDFKINMKPTVFNFGPFHYKDVGVKNRRTLNSLRNRVESYLNSRSNEQLRKLLVNIQDVDLTREIHSVINERQSHANLQNGWLYKIGLIPTFTEVVLFLTALTFVLLIFSNSLFFDEFFNFFLYDFDGEMIVIMIFFIIGLVVSFYHAFSNKQVPRKTKSYMLLFAIMMNFFVGFSSGIYMLENSSGIFLILPAINIISALLLLLFARTELISTKSISNKQAKLQEIIIGSILVIIVFIISQVVFHNYWAITFSLCLICITNINNIVSRFFS
jgi:hypothetical protein